MNAEDDLHFVMFFDVYVSVSQFLAKCVAITLLLILASYILMIFFNFKNNVIEKIK